MSCSIKPVAEVSADLVFGFILSYHKLDIKQWLFGILLFDILRRCSFVSSWFKHQETQAKSRVVKTVSVSQFVHLEQCSKHTWRNQEVRSLCTITVYISTHGKKWQSCAEQMQQNNWKFFTDEHRDQLLLVFAGNIVNCFYIILKHLPVNKLMYQKKKKY